MPAHNHGVTIGVNTSSGEESAPTNNIAARANSFSEDATTGAYLGGVNQTTVGGNLPFNIRNPYLGISHCIATEGVFPSRN